MRLANSGRDATFRAGVGISQGRLTFKPLRSAVGADEVRIEALASRLPARGRGVFGVVVVATRIEGRLGTRRELVQAFEQWIDTVRRGHDAEVHLYEDVEQPHRLCLISVWPRPEALASHLLASPFGNLVGAIEILASSSSVIVAEVEDDVHSLQELRRSRANRMERHGPTVA